MQEKHTRLDKTVVRFAQAIIRYRWAVVIASVLLTGFIGSGASGLFFNTDYRAFFSEDNEHVQAFDELQNVYTKNDNILFVIAPESGQAFSREPLEAIEDLVEKAWTIPYAIRVDAITNFQHTFAEYDDLIVEDLVEDAALQSEQFFSEAQRIALAEPLIKDRLINADASVTGVNVTLQLPGEDPGEGTEAVAFARVLADEFRANTEGVAVYMTGFAMLNNAFMEISQGELVRLMPIMFGLMILLMVLTLRSVSGTLVTMLVIAFSSAVAMGLGGFFNTGLTPPSAQAPTIIMTLAIADSIHILVTMLREMKHGLSKYEAIVESVRINFLPVFLTSLSTVIGFLSLNFSDVPPFHHLGNLTAVGVTAAFVLSVTFLPAVIAILPVRTKSVAEDESYSPVMDRLGDFIVRQRKPVLVASAAVAVAFAALIPLNVLDDQFVDYFAESTDFRKDTDFTSENLTGIYQVEFSIDSGESGGVSNPEFLDTVEQFANWYRTQPEVVHVSSITDIMKRLNKNLNGDDASFYRLPDNREMAAQYLLLYEMSLPYGLDLNNQINVDKSATRFTVTTSNLSASRLRDLTELGQTWLVDNGSPSMQATGSGPGVMFAYVSGVNIKSMLKGSALALMLISFLMIFALKSVRLGLISFIPNLLPAIIGFGIWAVISGTVNIGLSIVIGMTLGIVVDDSIHFLTKYKRARTEQGLDAEDAVRYAFSSVGRALVVTTIILVVGFLVLSTSVFGMNADMGLMTAITIALALGVDLFALPPILMWLDGKEVVTADETSLVVSKALDLKPAPIPVQGQDTNI